MTELEKAKETIKIYEEALNRISMAKADRLDHSFDVTLIDRMVKVAKTAISQARGITEGGK